ncbi:MAG: bifunctional hydroxymethylpyrimidine kinase/phosphomethylpyrimidine kinase [Pseudomonadales bacterium]|nr:bifunctional hydroxymethylpyrimidine kinase/phosphomethylpyrimidine kinase [Pseudomonadales bacterium]
MSSTVHRSTPPRVLSIAGSDSSAGAGIQADLKTISACGAYALTALTAITAQDPQGVQAMWPVTPEQLREQILCALRYQPAAIKLGMLGSAALVQVVMDCLNTAPHIPLVIDPIIRASSGAILLDAEGVQLLREHLLVRAQIITPNRQEARALFDGDDEHTLHDWVQEHKVAVLLTGGDSAMGIAGEPRFCTDVLFTTNNIEHHTAPYIETNNHHGTGCTLSAALASFLAHGFALHEAVQYARQFVQQALRAGAQQQWPGCGPLHHFFAFGSATASENTP